MRARTIRVVFAAKLLKKLISIHLVYLVLKLLSVPVPAQRRLHFSSLCMPQFDGFVFAAAGKHGSVGAPRNSSDKVRVPVHRAHGVDLLQITIFIKGAGTIRVVFAAKLLKKLILHKLSLLSLLCIKVFAGTCARSASTDIVQLRHPRSLQSCHR